jgi:hypothetical protein
VEGDLVTGFNLVIDYILEDLDDESQVEVAAFYEVAVLIIGLTVASEHPETFHDFGVVDCVRGVELWVVPD